MQRSFSATTLFSSFLFILFVTTCGTAQAAIRRVPADHPTIQQAINESVDGDTVLVSPGIYIENINFLGKTITVKSENGPQATIIDGNQRNSVVTFRFGEGPLAKLEGFTLRNGNANGLNLGINLSGGGINITGASPTIIGNIITDNKAADAGGGISLNGASPRIEANIITNNSRSPGFSGGLVGGGGIGVISGSSAQIIGNIISNNSHVEGGGISLSASGPIVIRNNKIFRNTALNMGGGISMRFFSPARIIQNLIVENQSLLGAGISLGFAASLSFGDEQLSLVNNTIADNDSPQSSGLFVDELNSESLVVNNVIVARTGQTAIFCRDFSTSTPILRFNNIFSPQGMAYGGSCPDKTGMDGNISADPLFVNTATDDYHLSPGSPSIDSGDNSAPHLPTTDLDGNPRIQDGDEDGASIVDMGAYEALPSAPPFDLCIKDDSNGNILRVNSATGDYQLTNCSGFTLVGVGTLSKRGTILTLQHNAADRRVTARIDLNTLRGTATIQVFSQGITLTITDRVSGPGTCSCGNQ